MNESMPSWSDFLKQVQEEDNVCSDSVPASAAPSTQAPKNRNVVIPGKEEQEKKAKREEEANQRRKRMLDDIKRKKALMKSGKSEGTIVIDKENIVNTGYISEPCEDGDITQRNESAQDVSCQDLKTDEVFCTERDIECESEERSQQDKLSCEVDLQDSDKEDREKVLIEPEETKNHNQEVSVDESPVHFDIENINSEQKNSDDNVSTIEKSTQSPDKKTLDSQANDCTSDCMVDKELDSLEVDSTTPRKRSPAKRKSTDFVSQKDETPNKEPKLKDLLEIGSGVLLTPIRRAKLRKKREDNLRDMRERMKRFDGTKFQIGVKDSKFKISKPFVEKSRDAPLFPATVPKEISLNKKDSSEVNGCDTIETLKKSFVENLATLIGEYTDNIYGLAPQPDESNIKLQESEEKCIKLEAQVKELTKELNILKAKALLQDTKIMNVQEQLELKIEENEKLTQICDELISSLESNQHGSA